MAATPWRRLLLAMVHPEAQGSQGGELIAVMSSEEKTPESWPPRIQLKTPPYTFPVGLEFPLPPPPSGRRLLIMTIGAVTALAISVLGVLLATYLGRVHCSQLNVQNEASLLLAFSELSDQAAVPGITCDLKNHLMVYHGQPEGCVAQKMDATESLPSCQELEIYFQAVLRNITLGLSLDVQVVGVGSLGTLVTLLCNNKATYLLSPLPAPSRGRPSLAA
ncbi:uncharacterized protein LOC130320669 isoform X2 [Hyla sarda]|uniref:uncharacterized protein LOC130320669 isoform X2 n=1 Tax=Hyla sarda TaxID=327740 RepID=UPI0024C20DFE|nr:uncharacterized protein LOC130320669 isoform X2 [Hyla sarda]